MKGDNYMKFEKIVYCHWDLVRFVTEENLKSYDSGPMTISVTDSTKKELMIFLGKNDTSDGYEVRVHKCKENGQYVPSDFDRVHEYVAGKDFDTFFFDEYELARDFVDTLPYHHKEYQVRPVRTIGKI